MPFVYASNTDSAALNVLIDFCNVQRIDKDFFHGQTRDYGQGNLFGGHLLAQGLASAYQTVPLTQLCHSLHAYFLQATKFDEPVDYHVIHLKDGKRFSARQIHAKQNGRLVFTMMLSFHSGEQGLTHQQDMPEVDAPEQWDSDYELAHKLKDFIPERYQKIALAERAIQGREVNPNNPIMPEVRTPERFKWHKLNASIEAVTEAYDGTADEHALLTQRLQQMLLAYTSDMGLLGVGLYPHGESFLTGNIQAASIDHALWFHAPIDFAQWHLFHMTSPQSGAGKALAQATIYQQDGTIIASSSQQGLIRVKSR